MLTELAKSTPHLLRRRWVDIRRRKVLDSELDALWGPVITVRTIVRVRASVGRHGLAAKREFERRHHSTIMMRKTMSWVTRGASI